MGAKTEHKYLILSPESWSSLPTNKHQISLRLHELDREVVYVDWVGKSILSFLRRSRELAALTDDPGFKILRLWRLPQSITHRFPKLLATELHLKQMYLMHWLRKHQYQPTRVLAYDPTSANVRFDRNETVTIFHCVDHYASFPDWQRGSGALMTQLERQLVQQSDYVVVTSQALLEHWAEFTDAIEYMPNVADTDLFGSLNGEACRLARGEVQVPSDRKLEIFFHGNLVPWKIDFGLITELARKLKETNCGRLTLVGPLGGSDSAQLREALAQQGVRLLPPRSQPEIVELLADVDVLLLPYIVNSHTKHVFPLKFMEYMATGLPIISTRLPSIVDLGDGSVEFVNCADEIIDLLCGNGLWRTSGGQKRKDIAGQYSWANRVTAIESLFGTLETNGASQNNS